MRRVLVVAAAAVAVGLAGCAQGATNAGPAYSVGDGIAEAGGPLPAGVLDGWRDFPAGTHPRPIVLIGAVVLNPGYATGEAKIAAIEAGYSLPAVLPELPSATTSVALPDGAATLPLVDARTAAQTLRRDVQPSPSGIPLPIVSVAFGTATFRTDRGDLPLPAWLFTARDGLGPIAVPALAPSAFWHFEVDQESSAPQPAKVSPDGRTLTVPVVQAPADCAGNPPVMAPEVRESAGAVAVGARPVSPAPQSTGCFSSGVLVFVEITVNLAEPLGGRVLVDARERPVQVVTG